jgi:hypothetical protein
LGSKTKEETKKEETYGSGILKAAEKIALPFPTTASEDFTEIGLDSNQS